MSVSSSSLFLWNFDRNSSDNWNFFQNWNWNSNVSSYWNSFINRILLMINIVLLEIFLNNRLSDYYFPGNINSLLSNYIIDLGGFGNRIKLNSLVLTSLHLKINLFFLNDWENKSIFHYFSSRTNNSLNFFIFSHLQFPL